MKRFYTDGPFGQIHVRMAAATSQATKPALVCFHQSPSSGHIYETFAAQMASNRNVYAPDTPGFGASDRPSEPPLIEDYADAMEALLDGLGEDEVDLLGYHTGAMTAMEIAIRRPDQVRRLVLAGIPVFTKEESDDFLSQPWPKPISEDGSHLPEEWGRGVQWKGPGQTLDMLAKNFTAKMLAGPQSWWGGRAAFLYPSSEKLPQVTQPILAIRAADDLEGKMLRAQPLMKNYQWVDLPDLGFGMWEVAPERLATIVRGHLD